LSLVVITVSGAKNAWSQYDRPIAGAPHNHSKVRQRNMRSFAEWLWRAVHKL